MIVEQAHCLLRFRNPRPIAEMLAHDFQYYRIRKRDGALVRLRGQKLRYGTSQEIVVRTRSGRLRSLAIALQRQRVARLLREATVKVILVSLDGWKQCNWYMTLEELGYVRKLGIAVRIGCRWPSEREWERLDRDWEMGKVRSRWLPPLEHIERLGGES